MSDAPLSRRARRALEEQAAERSAQDNLGAGAPFGAEASAATPQSGAVSRRDRRRLERLQNPMETWTAEEEMIATGQIPVLTPERIAEQEKLAREKAEQAARDAQLASREFRALTERDVRPADAAPAAPAEPAWPAPQQAPADGPFSAPVQPPVPQPTQQPATQPWAPADEWPVPAQPEQPTPTPADAWQAPSQPDVRPAAAPYTPVFDFGADDEPEAPAEPTVPMLHDAEPDIADDAAARAKLFSAMYPPGSAQAMLAGQDAGADDQVEPAVEEPSATTTDAVVTPAAELPAAEPNPIDEIRRLAEEAMSGIERASQRTDAATPESGLAAQEPATAASEWPTQRLDESGTTAAWGSGPAAEPEPAVPQTHQAEQPQAPQAEQSQSPWGYAEPEQAPASWEQAPQTEPQTPQGGSPFAERQPEPQPQAPWGFSPSPQPQPQQPEQAPSTPSDGLAPHHASFDEAVRTSGGIPQAAQPATPASGAFQQVPQQPAANPWGAHPLENVQPQAPASDPNDFTPVPNATRPDFSQLYQAPGNPFSPVTGATPQAPASGQLPTSGQFPSGNPFASTGSIPTGAVPTGSLPTESTATGAFRRPEVPKGPEPREFKWLHLGVIGALMFVLGVFIYNVAFNK